jgi:hypothetical protein
MFGIDRIDIEDLLKLVPMGKVEQMIREKSPHLMLAVVQAIEANVLIGHPVDDGQQLTFRLVRTVHNGRETLVAIPEVVTMDFTVVKRLPFYDLTAWVEAMPWKQILSEVAAMAKRDKEADKLLAAARKALAKGDTAKAKTLSDKADALLKMRPKWMRTFDTVGENADTFNPLPPHETQPDADPKTGTAVTGRPAASEQ